MFRYNDNRASSEDSSVRFRGAREATFTEVMNKFGRGLSVIDGRFRRGAEVMERVVGRRHMKWRRKGGRLLESTYPPVVVGVNALAR